MLIWYLARGAGLAGFLMLSVATAVGAIVTRKWSHPDRRIQWQYVHRAAALGGVALIALHVGTLLADSYAHVGTVGLLPFGSGYRPFAVTLGTIAAYVLATVAVTGILRSRMAKSQRMAEAWRGIHLVSYIAWILAASHFYLAGTDVEQRWAWALLAGCSALVAIGGVARIFDQLPDRQHSRGSDQPSLSVDQEVVG